MNTKFPPELKNLLKELKSRLNSISGPEEAAQIKFNVLRGSHFFDRLPTAEPEKEKKEHLYGEPKEMWSKLCKLIDERLKGATFPIPEETLSEIRQNLAIVVKAIITTHQVEKLQQQNELLPTPNPKKTRRLSLQGNKIVSEESNNDEDSSNERVIRKTVLPSTSTSRIRSHSVHTTEFPNALKPEKIASKKIFGLPKSNKTRIFDNDAVQMAPYSKTKSSPKVDTAYDYSPVQKSSTKKEDLVSSSKKRFSMTISSLQQSILPSKAEEFATSILKVFETQAPNEWQSVGQEKKDKMKEEIMVQLIDFIGPNPNSAAKKKQKKGKLTTQQFVFDSEISPRILPCINLIDLMQSFLNLITTFMGGYNESLEINLLDKNELKQLLNEAIIRIAKVLTELDMLFPSSFDFEGVLVVWKRIMENLGDVLKGKVLPYSENLLYEGQFIKLMRKELLENLIFHTENIYCLTVSLASFLQVVQTDNQGSRLCILAYIGAFKEACSSIMSIIYTLYDIDEKYQPSDLVVQNKIDDEKPVWEDGEEVVTPNFDAQDKFRPGTLNNLILRLTTSGFDNKFFLSFIIGYNGFCTPAEFYYKLLQRYKNPIEPNLGQKPEMVMKTTAVVVLAWCKKDFFNINSGLINQIKRYAEVVLPKDNIKDFAAAILKQISDSSKISLRELRIQKNLPVYAFDMQPHQFLRQADAIDVAEQMTLIDLEIYHRIGFHELIQLKWTKDKLRILSPNVDTMLKRTNAISFWVSSTILFQQKLVDRAKILKKMVYIARCLLDLGNYNSLIGVLVGLNMSCISRLRNTFGSLQKKVIEELKNLNVYQDPSGGFRYLRNAIKTSNASVPYLGIHLSDLTMIDENAEFINVGDKKLINLHKHQLVNNTISDYLQFRTENYKESFIRQEPLYSLLYNLPFLGEKELWMLSNEREPKISE